MTRARYENPQTHFRYLDGLRGLAALYVVLFHCRTEFTWRDDGGFSRFTQLATQWMNYGHYAVVVFIVLSGYCLMLPVARAGRTAPPEGLGSYLKRRAWRTLPAYYGALALSLSLTAISPALQKPVGAQWDRCLPAFARDTLLSHLLMLHNLRREWHLTIDAPMWSMATEWDIYFVFALLLLPLWRRGGIVLATLSACFLGLLPHRLLPVVSNFDWACPWFLGCFALGMAGAAVSVSEEEGEGRWRTRLPWAPLSVSLWIALLMVCLLLPHWQGQHWHYVDLLVAAATACFFVAAGCAPGGQRGWLLRGLSSRPMVLLGSISYSLYLIHFPILALYHSLIRHYALRPDSAYLLLMALALPTSLIAAVLFQKIFEAPFLGHSRRRTKPSGDRETTDTLAKSGT